MGWECHAVEWPLRIASFTVLGAAIVAIRKKPERQDTDWQTVLHATPRGLVAALIGVLLYWAGSLVFFVVLGYASEARRCQDLTARMLAPWAVAAAVLDAAARGGLRVAVSQASGDRREEATDAGMRPLAPEAVEGRGRPLVVAPPFNGAMKLTAPGLDGAPQRIAGLDGKRSPASRRSAGGNGAPPPDQRPRRHVVASLR
jgi:hypothetical protein